MQKFDFEVSKTSARDNWARYHVQQSLRTTFNTVVAQYERITPLIPSWGSDLDDFFRQPLGKDDELKKPPPELLKRLKPPKVDGSPKVCIVGAGAAGLFTALLIDYLKQQVPTLQLEYDIFEARPETEPSNPLGIKGAKTKTTATNGNFGPGGRLYTYQFPKDPKDPDPDNPHYYYDVGAMRFPDNEIMTRTFALFGYLDMNKLPPNKTSGKPTDIPIGTLIPYYIKGVNEPWFYNGINQTGLYSDFADPAPNDDPFSMSDISHNPISPDALKAAAAKGKSPEDVYGYAIQPYVDALTKDPESGWVKLMTLDTMSTSYFLTQQPPEKSTPQLQPQSPQSPPPSPPMPPYNYNTIEWLETFNGGTNWYDQAQSENVLEYMDFQADEWWCIEGGAQQLAINMANKLQNKASITFNTFVTGIDTSTPNAAKIQINGTWQGPYAAVFNSTTLGSMQQMDLSKAGLNYGQKLAIRSLGYGASCKIGMKFQTEWWRDKFGITQGGLGHSDSVIRTTVYPSYNLNDTGPAVLLCSYEWQQDAQRVGTLISSSSDHATALAEEAELKEVVLRDLANLHANHPANPMTPQEVYDLISPLYMDHYAHDWYHDNTAFGAFAFYRPQQFGAMWPYIIAPSTGVIVIGEHASNHHAWVVGALESAINGLYNWLSYDTVPGAADAIKAMNDWNDGGQGPTSGNPFAGLPSFTTEVQRQWHRVFGLLHEAKFREQLTKTKHEVKA